MEVPMRREPETKRHEVARTLEAAILDGRIKPSTRMTELKLAAELGVSQASVREALQELESLGLVVKYPNRGSYVINLQPMDLIHIYQVRGELEPLAWFLAAAQMNQQTLDVLRSCVEDMRNAVRNGDYRAYSSLDYRFHSTIWESQGNRYLEKSLKALCLPLFAHDLVHHCAYTSPGLDRALRQHERLLAVLQMGDPSLVLNVVRRMMRKFLRQDLTGVGVHQWDSKKANQSGEEEPFTCQMPSALENAARKP